MRFGAAGGFSAGSGASSDSGGAAVAGRFCGAFAGAGDSEGACSGVGGASRGAVRREDRGATWARSLAGSNSIDSRSNSRFTDTSTIENVATRTSGLVPASASVNEICERGPRLLSAV